MTVTEYQPVLDFWFGDKKENIEVIKEKSPLWWRKDEDTDREIKQQFEPLLRKLIEVKLQHWKEDANGYLAMIILVDQFSRNMYRNQAQSFSQDQISLSLAIEGIEKGMDKQLRLIERAFFYLPFEHSESLQHQRRSVDLFNKLLMEANEAEQKYFSGTLDYAIKHQAVIERFGRYPHRNTILGRESTPEEIEFLQEPGSSF